MNKRYTLIILLPLCLLFIFTGARAQVTAPLTGDGINTPASIIPTLSDAYLDRLIAAAKAYYPHVKEVGHRVNVAKGNVDKAKTSWLEPFTLSYVYQPQQNSLNLANVSYSYFNGLQLGVFFNLGTFLEKPANVRVAKEELAAAANDRDEYLINLTLDVKRRYYAYVQRVASVKLLTQAAMDAYNAVQEVKHKYQKSEETFDNYNRAQITYAQQNELRLQAEANMLTAKAELEALVGDKLENIK